MCHIPNVFSCISPFETVWGKRLFIGCYSEINVWNFWSKYSSHMSIQYIISLICWSARHIKRKIHISTKGFVTLFILLLLFSLLFASIFLNSFVTIESNMPFFFFDRFDWSFILIYWFIYFLSVPVHHSLYFLSVTNDIHTT